MAELTIILKDGDYECSVSAPVTKVDIKTLDWLTDSLQHKLATNEQGRALLS